MFSFVRNHQTVFQTGCSAFPPAMNELLLVLHAWHHLVLAMFQILATGIRVQEYTIVLTCIFLIAFDMGHIFI